MSKNHVLTPRARLDLRDIVGYIAKDNPAAARNMKSAIMGACVRLGENPSIGQFRADLTRKPVRFWPVHPNYLIIYDAASSPIRILRVYHAARDYDVMAAE